MAEKEQFFGSSLKYSVLERSRMEGRRLFQATGSVNARKHASVCLQLCRNTIFFIAFPIARLSVNSSSRWKCWKWLHVESFQYISEHCSSQCDIGFSFLLFG